MTLIMNRHICWDSTMLRKVLDADALQIENHQFLATHSPIKMYRDSNHNAEGKGGIPYSEEEFYKDFLKPDDYIFVSVLGQSGTGKSHLIRWMAAHIPQTNNRRVLLIPRSTNLRNILLMILDGMEGPEFDEYRNRILRATEKVTLERAKEELRNQIATVIGPNGPHRGKRLSEEEEYLSSELPHLFYDPYIRETFVKKGGVLDRLAQHVIGNDEQGGRLDDRRKFTIEDLPLQVIDVRKASYNAIQIYTQLNSNDELKQMAVDWINKNLDVAITQMLNLNGTDLVNLMNEVRASLAEQKIELVLLIEDFSMLQGIDYQLLDALILRPKQYHRPLCALRVALACTTGYYQTLPDTVRTRVEYLVKLDVDGLLTDEDRELFVSRYLNALRLRDNQVQDWYKDRLNGSVEKLPSACEDCALQDRCHSAFGAKDGMGLYPFNTDAIRVMYKRSTSEYFNPRILIGKVMLHVLDNYGSNIKEGTFPPVGLLEHFGPRTQNRLEALQENQLRSRDSLHAERRRTLIELWSGSNEVVDLHPILHEAFDLPQLNLEPSDTKPEDKKNDGKSPPLGEDQGKPGPSLITVIPESVQSMLDLIENWGNQAVLPQRKTGDFRELVFSAINSHIDWDSELLRKSWWIEKRLWANANINFKGQITIPSNKTIGLTVPLRDEEWNETTIALKGLVLHNHYGNWQFPNGTLYFRFSTRMLRLWSQRIVQLMREMPTGEGTSCIPENYASELLVLGAVLDGRMHSGMALPEQIEAVFRYPEASQSLRSQTWQNLHSQFRKSFQDLMDVALSHMACQKGGKASNNIIDASPVLLALKRLHNKWEPTTLNASKIEIDSIRSMNAEFRNNFSKAVQSEIEEKQRWHEFLAKSLDKRPEKEEWDQIQKAIQAIQQKGFVGDEQSLRYVKENFKLIRELPIASLLKNLSALSSVKVWHEAIPLLMKSDLPSANALVTWVNHLNQLFNTSQKRIDRNMQDLRGNQGGMDTEGTRKQIQLYFSSMKESLHVMQNGGQP